MTERKVGEFGVNKKNAYWGRFHHYVSIMQDHRSVM